MIIPNPDSHIQASARPGEGNPISWSSNFDSTCMEIVMRWSIKSTAGSPKDLFWSQLGIVAIHAAVLAGSAFILWDIFIEDHKFFIAIIAMLTAQTLYAIGIMRQKTAYHYNIYPTNAKIEYQLQLPKHAGIFFKGMALVGIFILLLIGLMTGSLLLLIGPGAIAFIAALRLLTWKNPIKRETSLPWHEYNFVTVDRKRRFIVTHVSDLTLGFEARLPDDALFEQYLAFLHSVLPPTAQFTEKKWDMSLI